MSPNIAALRELIESKFDNNQSEFAKTLGIERSHLNKILKSDGKCAGRLFISGLLSYCDENNMDYRKYIN